MALLIERPKNGEIFLDPERMGVILVIVLSLLLGSSDAAATADKIIGSVGGFADFSARVGRGGRIAMELAVHDFINSTDSLVVNQSDRSGISARAPSLAIDFIKSQEVQEIVSTLTWQDATIITEMDGISLQVPVISNLTRIVLIKDGSLVFLTDFFSQAASSGFHYRLLYEYIPSVYGLSRQRLSNGLEMPVRIRRRLSNGREMPVRIGVQVISNFTQFMIIKDGNKNVTFLTGFSIDIFQAAVSSLHYQLPYEFIPFYGSSDEMVEMVYQKKLDAAIGDVEITADRRILVEFSQPYIDSGLVMVVPLKSNKSRDLWMFMKPFTKTMWSLMAAMSMLTGAVVWLIEHRINSDFRDPPSQQVGKVLWFSFTTLYLGQSDSLRSNLSRFVMAPWLLLILIISASFTASLTSMMTTSRLEQSELDVGLLKRTNAAVGCDGSTLSARYLVQVLGFKKENINSFSLLDDYAEALKDGHIRAAFLAIPHAKVFTAKYCKDFTTAGPTYKLAGYGFVFPKNSPLALDISEAIQRLAENGYRQQLENEMFSSFSCFISQTDTNADQSLGPEPFAGLFILSGAASAIALFIEVTRRWGMRWLVMTFIQATLMGKGIWKRAAMLLARNQISDELQQPNTFSLPQTEGNNPPAPADSIS